MAGTLVDIAYILVEFRTNNDDKDDDTLVIIDISPFENGAKGQNIAGYTGYLGGHLNDNSNSGTYTLSFKPGFWNSGADYMLTVAIDPNGHDTWRFDCYLYIQIFNGPEKTYTFMGHALSQDVRSNDYRFVL